MWVGGRQQGTESLRNSNRSQQKWRKTSFFPKDTFLSRWTPCAVPAPEPAFCSPTGRRHPLLAARCLLGSFREGCQDVGTGTHSASGSQTQKQQVGSSAYLLQHCLHSLPAQVRWVASQQPSSDALLSLPEPLGSASVSLGGAPSAEAQLLFSRQDSPILRAELQSDMGFCDWFDCPCNLSCLLIQ